MAYVTRAEFEKWMLEGDRTAILSDLSDADKADWIEEALIAAQGDLDGYATSRYALPLAATPQVKGFVKKLARWELLKRKDWNYNESEQKQEKELRAQLLLIVKREFHLTDQTPKTTANDRASVPSGGSAAKTGGRERQFTRDKLKGF